MTSTFGSRRTARFLGVFALSLLAGARAFAADGDARVRVTTSMGEFVIALETERTPLTVANFLRYVKEGHYSGTLFHRVVANFVIQGGGHAAADYALKPTHPPVVNEAGNGLVNRRGTVGLARSEGPHTGNCQFYVNLVDNPDLNPLPSRWGYAVFGEVVEGMEVVDRIGVVPTGKAGPFKGDAPLQPVIIEKIELIDSTGASLPPSSAAPVSPDAPSGASASDGSPAE